ncbi:hypothetical protein MPSEU_000440600 [Mayamaea pseudoterrestris]|nr:hypothetical protein MPSEU_000440600 [Mayamaea pseudoterrestris]
MQPGTTQKGWSITRTTFAATASPPLKAATKSQFAQKLNTKSNEPPRLLAALSAHTGSSVLAVRFSTTGKYLASAGDDAVVCIYERSNVASAASGNLTGHYNHHHHHAHAEHWIRIHCCRGHELDVVDLAWAPDDSYLVSCSLDSQTPIIVWKIADDFDSRNSSKGIIKSPYKVLGRGVHTSTVKGVCFDPAGSYIASSGDDPAVCIWRAHDDWGLEQRIDASSGIFRQWHANDDSVSLSSQSLFRRISWATDGAFLCSTNSVVKNKHVASTISRQSWNVSSGSHVSTGAANLVGHKQPVVVSRHAPQMLSAKKRRERALQNDEIEHEADDEAEDDEDEEPQHAMLLALGDKRGFVTVWSTKKSRPIFKLQCSESRCTVTDLSWLKLPTSDNLVLLISLLDGQLVAVNFAVPSELGALLSKKRSG